MHALVTGGNGHLGYNLVKALPDGGHTVRAREAPGWMPKISLEQSLRDTMAVFRARREARA
jgi:nucleoside-diphosphate-sugar epimerase